MTNYEWDPKKAGSNLAKHGVSFDLAIDALEDPFVITVFSSKEGEDRWKAIGAVFGTQVLSVVYALRNNKNTIRIISARKASNTERVIYDQQNK